MPTDAMSSIDSKHSTVETNSKGRGEGAVVEHAFENGMTSNRSTWTYRSAWAVALTLFPLIWVGGLVTTQDAGMAVPDWPGTYGFNMFAYPIGVWLYGPFDLLIEHGHRLLGSLAGFLAIVLCIVASINEKRIYVKRMTYLLLAAIIVQGLLGGFRVLFDARTLAMIHGVTGPLVFALAASTVVVLSPWWSSQGNLKSWDNGQATDLQSTDQDRGQITRKLRWAAVVLTVVSVIQLYLGAQLRHVLPTATPTFFMSIVHLHLTFAAMLTAMILGVAIVARTEKYRKFSGIAVPSALLVFLLSLQIGLGFGTWIANYAWPWVEANQWLAQYTIAAKGYWESWIVTGHQATGSLIIVTSLVFTMRLWRLQYCCVGRQSLDTQSRLVG